jgi:hypothetical protein
VKFLGATTLTIHFLEYVIRPKTGPALVAYALGTAHGTADRH